MTDRRSIRQVKKSGEEGYVLIGVIILLALFVIAMAVAAPKVAKQIQRDRDLETMRRGRQYIRAIQLYYRKFHAYPPNIDALVKTQEIRFLRRRYLDPTTGKDDWKPVYMGQNKTPMAMGFFGQPLGGTGGNVLAGTGPGGVGSSIGTPVGSGSTGQSTFGSSTGQSTFGSSTGQSTFGSTQQPSSTFGSSSSGNSGSGTSGSGDPSGSSSGSSSSSGFGDSGMTMGGAVVGVSPVSAKQSIFVYKTKNHYNEWEFLYSPQSDMPGMAGGSTGMPTSGTTGSGTGTQTNSGFGFGNTGSGSSNTNSNNGNSNSGTGTGFGSGTSPSPQ